MFAYFLVSFLSIFFSLLYDFSNKKDKYAKLMVFLSFLTLFLFSAIRYNVYNDYIYTYVPEYNKIATGTYSTSHYEPLFYLLNLFVYKVFNNVDFLFFITSFLFIFFIAKALKEKSTCISLSIFLMIFGRMYFYSFDQIRQYIAIAIFIYNIKNIASKNFKKYSILTLVGGLIHKLSFIYFPLYFLNRLNLSKRKYILTIIIILVLSPLYITVVTLIAKYFYPNYFNYVSYINGTRMNNSIVLIILSLLNLLLSVIYYKKINTNNYNKILLNIQLVLLFIIIGTWNLFDSYRIVALFTYTSILLIPEIVKSENNKKNRFILLTLIFCIYIISGYTFIKNVSIVYPYRTIFNKY